MVLTQGVVIYYHLVIVLILLSWTHGSDRNLKILTIHLTYGLNPSKLDAWF